MKRSILKESNILIAVDALKKIISIFVGPFLTAYFLKVSADSLIDLSIYNIMSYIVFGFGGLIMGFFVKSKFQIGMFRVGIIANFFYILTIIILQEKILKHLPLMAFLYGFSSIAYFYPRNLFLSSKINNSERASYEFKKKTTTMLVSTITPVVLGGIIVTTNFRLTAIIVLFISLIEIILSFFLKPIKNGDKYFTLIKSFKIFSKNKDIMNMFWVEYFRGMNVSYGALGVVITVLIFNAFKTELNIGILSSICHILIVVFQYIYVKNFKNRNDKCAVLICSIVPMTTLLALVAFTNNITLVLYYFCYTVLVDILSFILDVRSFNISNCKVVKNENQLEFWSIREAILNLGRVTGYTLLFLVAISGNFNYLYYLMIFLTLCIALSAYFASKVGKYDDID